MPHNIWDIYKMDWKRRKKNYKVFAKSWTIQLNERIFRIYLHLPPNDRSNKPFTLTKNICIMNYRLRFWFDGMCVFVYLCSVNVIKFNKMSSFYWHKSIFLDCTIKFSYVLRCTAIDSLQVSVQNRKCFHMHFTILIGWR